MPPATFLRTNNSVMKSFHIVVNIFPSQLAQMRLKLLEQIMATPFSAFFCAFPFGLCVFNLIKIVYAVAHKFADRNSSSVWEITTKLRKFPRIARNKRRVAELQV